MLVSGLTIPFISSAHHGFAPLLDGCKLDISSLDITHVNKLTWKAIHMMMVSTGCDDDIWVVLLNVSTHETATVHCTKWRTFTI